MFLQLLRWICRTLVRNARYKMATAGDRTTTPSLNSIWGLGVVSVLWWCLGVVGWSTSPFPPAVPSSTSPELVLMEEWQWEAMSNWLFHKHRGHHVYRHKSEEGENQRVKSPEINNQTPLPVRLYTWWDSQEVWKMWSLALWAHCKR